MDPLSRTGGELPSAALHAPAARPPCRKLECRMPFDRRCGVGGRVRPVGQRSINGADKLNKAGAPRTDGTFSIGGGGVDVFSTLLPPFHPTRKTFFPLSFFLQAGAGGAPPLLLF